MYCERSNESIYCQRKILSIDDYIQITKQRL